MIDTEALRKKVIDLAIPGKLTEQLPSDEDAEALQVFCRNMFQWMGSVDRTFGPYCDILNQDEFKSVKRRKFQ